VEERRNAVRRATLKPAALALVAALLVGSVGEACEGPSGFTPRARVESAGIVVVFRTVPPAIEVGRHFSLEALVCAEGPAPVLTRVDADMPEHRHGMNYRPSLAAKDSGRYVAEGLLFHMPGRWQLSFDVEHAGRRTRLTTDVLLE
jgi:hypothetical protein